MLDIGKFWLSNKRHCILNMITLVVIWSVYKKDLLMDFIDKIKSAASKTL